MKELIFWFDICLYKKTNIYYLLQLQMTNH